MFDTAVLVLSNFCYGKCRFCGNPSPKFKKFEKHISVQDAKKFIEFSIKLGCRSLDITGGGEPTTRFKDVLKIMNFAKNKKMNIRLITNACFASTKEKSIKMLSDMEKAGLDKIYISFDYDHLLSVPYKNYLNILEPLLDKKIAIIILCVDTKTSEKENTENLKKLSRSLKGIYKTPIFQHNLFDKKILGNLSLIITKNKKIIIFRYPLEYEGRARELVDEFDFRKKERIIFNFPMCFSYEFLALDFMNGINTYCFYSGGIYFKYNEKTTMKDIVEGKLIWNKIVSTYGFIKLFLSIKNLEKEKNKKLLKEKYPTFCSLCWDVIKILRKEKLKEPPKIQTFSFLIRHIIPFTAKTIYSHLLLIWGKTFYKYLYSAS